MFVVRVLALFLLCALAAALPVRAQDPPPTFDYRVLATSRTSTMEKEMNEAAAAGYRYRSVMGGDTAMGGSEVVVVMMSGGSEPEHRYEYRLLATNRTSTMERELRDAADAGYEYRGQTVFESTFGGDEVVCILERRADREAWTRTSYRLVATSRTSTFQRELQDAGAEGYEIVGMTVGRTALGGSELVAIMRAARP